MADYDQDIALKPNYAEAYNGRGIVRSNRGDYNGAIAECTKAIAINPKLAVAYYNRSWVYLYLGKGESAHGDALYYLRLTNPNSSDTFRLYMVVTGYFGLRQTSAVEEGKAFLDHHAL